jgi:hypothetical protein
MPVPPFSSALFGPGTRHLDLASRRDSSLADCGRSSGFLAKQETTQ